MSSIRTRILFIFTLFAILAGSVVFISNREAHIIGSAAGDVVTEHLPMVHALGQLGMALNRQDDAVYRFLSTKDKYWLDEVEKEKVDFDRWYSEAWKWSTEDLEVDRLQEIDQLYIKYDNHIRQLLLTASRSNQSTKKMVAEGIEYLEHIRSAVDQIISMRQGMTIVLQSQIKQTLERTRLFTIYFPLIVFGFFIVLAIYLWRFLVKPLSLLLEGIQKFTRGKTDIHLPNIGKDELGQLQEAFNEMSREINVERTRLKSESQSDSLTGLFNMRYFRTQLTDEFSRSQRYSHPMTLLMLDVDHFKHYNDRNGHPAGDIVLKEVARILIRNVRGTDIVARYGGEEFVILLPETPLSSANHVAEKIRKAVEGHHFPFRETQLGHKVTLSIGIGAYPDKRVTSDQDLVEAADKALYEAKKNGRNRVMVFSKGEFKENPAIGSHSQKRSA